MVWFWLRLELNPELAPLTGISCDLLHSCLKISHKAKLVSSSKLPVGIKANINGLLNCCYPEEADPDGRGEAMLLCWFWAVAFPLIWSEAADEDDVKAGTEPGGISVKGGVARISWCRSHVLSVQAAAQRPTTWSTCSTARGALACLILTRPNSGWSTSAASLTSVPTPRR